MGKIRITVHTERGDQTIEVDPRVAGCLANGAMATYEHLFDGHGHLVDPNCKDIADDLAVVNDMLREVYEQEVHTHTDTQSK